MTTQYSEDQIKKANEEMSAYVKDAYTALDKAKDIADVFGLEFSFGVTYGAGASYTGKNAPKEDWEESDDWEDSDSYGWKASSQSC
jgi:hypothetical protein